MTHRGQHTAGDGPERSEQHPEPLEDGNDHEGHLPGGIRMQPNANAKTTLRMRAGIIRQIA